MIWKINLSFFWGFKGGGTIRHFVTLNFVQAAFGPKTWDIRLKFCMQPQIVVISMDPEENLRSEVTTSRIIWGQKGSSN